MLKDLSKTHDECVQRHVSIHIFWNHTSYSFHTTTLSSQKNGITQTRAVSVVFLVTKTPKETKLCKATPAYFI